jgi:lysophospholipase L1-like esterase
MPATRLSLGLVAGALLAIGVAAVTLVCAQDGPNPPPADPKDWPGKGTAGAYDLWTQRRETFWKNRRKEQGAVVFFGDSITHGWVGMGKAFPDLKVANRGIGSDSSRRLLFRLKEDVLDLNPRAVVILIGINDLNDGVPPADITDNLRLILDRIRAQRADTPVVLCHVMPWKKDARFPARIVQLNHLIDALAIGRPNVAVCDTWPGLATPEGTAKPELFRDGLHPNARGYEVWAASLRPVLARLKVTGTKNG